MQGWQWPAHLPWLGDVGKVDKPLFSVTIRDLTERKELDENLRESEERYRQVAAMTSDWIWEQVPFQGLMRKRSRTGVTPAI